MQVAVNPGCLFESPGEVLNVQLPPTGPDQALWGWVPGTGTSGKSGDPALIHLLVASLPGKSVQEKAFVTHASGLVTGQACFCLGLNMATAITFYFQLLLNPENCKIDCLAYSC